MSSNSKIQTFSLRRRRIEKAQIQKYLAAMYGYTAGPTQSRRGHSEPHTVTAASWSVVPLYETSDVIMAVTLNAACGQCPRSLRCLQGVIPRFVCPHCRRTNRMHRPETDELTHAPHILTAWPPTKPWDVPDIVEKGDHVPLSCPLWQHNHWIEPPQEGRCPRCRRSNYTQAVYSQPIKHRGTRKRRRLLYRAP